MYALHAIQKLLSSFLGRYLPLPHANAYIELFKIIIFAVHLHFRNELQFPSHLFNNHDNMIHHLLVISFVFFVYTVSFRLFPYIEKLFVDAIDIFITFFFLIIFNRLLFRLFCVILFRFQLSIQYFDIYLFSVILILSIVRQKNPHFALFQFASLDGRGYSNFR